MTVLGVVYLVFGLAILALTVVDILWTTLWVDGGSGPLSSRMTSHLWHVLRQFGDQRSRALSLAGPIILTATLLVWVAGIWGGWTLVFGSSEVALVSARNNTSITWVDRIYFVAYTMFTMGNGDFFPARGAYQIAASLTTASGMLFVTMGVSYVLSVLGAVSNKRSFASSVTGLGGRSETIVDLGWDGEDFDGLQLPLDSLANQLGLLADQHKAYPILHYYHSEEAPQSSAMAVAVFDEATMLLRHGVPEEQRPNEALLENARAATESYLETLNEAFIQPADESPPPPNLARLRASGVPTLSDEEFESTVDDLSERRRKLLSVVRADAWHWPPVDDE
jgi:hypothetical protein